MHELKAVMTAAAELHRQGLQPVLATVVEVSGSVYRRPGAHMLIGQGAPRVGMVSGGCLEQDVAERASELFHGGPPQLLTYDTRSSDDIVWGLGLGCNGVVSILVEPLASGSPVLEFWQSCLAKRETGVVSTVFAGNDERVGSRGYCSQARSHVSGLSSAEARKDALLALDQGRTKVVHYGSQSVLHELIAPPTRLLVCGAGPDAIPVVRIAQEIGWEVTIVDRRSGYANRDLFPSVDQILISPAPELELAPGDVAVVMAHNLEHDFAFLRAMLATRVGYIGVLGPRPRTQRFIEKLRLSAADQSRIYAPVGLDIGAETPEAIALSIIAEMQAVTCNRTAGFLRERSGPIHASVEQGISSAP